MPDSSVIISQQCQHDRAQYLVLKVAVAREVFYRDERQLADDLNELDLDQPVRVVDHLRQGLEQWQTRPTVDALEKIRQALRHVCQSLTTTHRRLVLKTLQVKEKTR